MNDAIPVVAIIVLFVFNVWQWWQREDMQRRIESQRSIIDIYREKGGVVFGDQEVQP